MKTDNKNTIKAILYKYEDRTISRKKYKVQKQTQVHVKD